MESTYVADNQLARQRLFDLTAQLTDETLAQKMPNGWSVSDTLAHLAFWDFYCLSLLTGWEKSGFIETHSSVQATNDAVAALSRAIPAQAVVKMVCDAATATDRKAEKIAPELAEAIIAGGQGFFLNRSVHRNLHLNKIATQLGL
jgi:uncharacterized damage-inducible protein DinB